MAAFSRLKGLTLPCRFALRSSNGWSGTIPGKRDLDEASVDLALLRGHPGRPDVLQVVGELMRDGRKVVGVADVVGEQDDARAAQVEADELDFLRDGAFVDG